MSKIGTQATRIAFDESTNQTLREYHEVAHGGVTTT